MSSYDRTYPEVISLTDDLWRMFNYNMRPEPDESLEECLKSLVAGMFRLGMVAAFTAPEWAQAKVRELQPDISPGIHAHEDEEVARLFINAHPAEASL